MNGCQGTCNQGRTTCDCMRWNGTSRDTQPGELLPTSDDPAEGHTGLWYAFGLALAAAGAGLGLAQWWAA